MTDQELKDLVASLAVAQAKTEAAQARTEAALVELTAAQERREAAAEKSRTENDRFLKEVGRRMGSMAANQGDVAEEFFYNSLLANPRVANIKFDSITPNLVVGTKGKQSEFDLVLINGKSVALIEVKYKTHVSDLDQLKAKIASYRKVRPEHKGFDIYAGLAGFSVPKDVVNAARDRGYFVLKRKGDVVETSAEAMTPF